VNAMMNNLSDILQTAGDLFSKKEFQAACDFLEENVESVAPSNVNSQDVIRYYLLLGEACWHTGRLHAAKKAFDCGLQREDEDVSPALKAEIRNDSALVDRNLGYYESAEKKYMQSKRLYEKANMDRSPHYLHLMNNLALLLKDMGRISDAEELFANALKILTEETNFPDVFQMRIENNYASLLFEKGDEENAKTYYFRSMKARIRKYGVHSPPYAESLNNLAVLYGETDTKTAIRLLEKSYGICRRLFDETHLNTAKTKKNLAVAKAKAGDYACAKQMLSEAIAVIGSRSGTDSPLYWRSLKELAIVEWKTGLQDEAKRLFEKIITFFANSDGIYSKDHFGCLYDYSRYLFQTGENERALLMLKQAAKMENDYFEQMIKGLPEDSAIKLVRKMAANTGYLISALLRYTETADLSAFYPVLYFRKGLVFEVTYLHRLEAKMSSDPEVKRKCEHYFQARKEVARRLFTGLSENEKADDFRKRQKDLIRQCVELERELWAYLPEIAIDKTEQRGLFERLNNRLAPSDVILDYYQYNRYDFEQGEYTHQNGYCVFLIKKDGKTVQLQLQPLLDEDSLEHLISQYRKIISGDDQTRGSGHSRISGINEIIKVCKRLYNALIPKAMSTIAADGENVIKRCHICPDGAISTIAFESLISPNDDFLLDEYCTNYYNNVRETVRYPNRTRHLKDITIFANPAYELSETITAKATALELGTRTNSLLNLLREKTLEDGYYPQLEGTQKEGDLLKAMFDADHRLTNDYFTGKEAFERKLRAVQSPSVLHLATHGFFITDDSKAIPHPLIRSGIVLSGVNSVLKGLSVPEEYEDGVFSAYDATTLSLENTEIVVLSACETGLGEIKTGEGILGLRRSFAQSGAKTIIMSLWRVSDKYTVYMMESFYKNLLKGKEIPEALRTAQLDLIEFLDDTFGFASPALWAGFICQGDPQSIQ